MARTGSRPATPNEHGSSPRRCASSRPRGISGRRVDAIAARAKVNKRMLYYYFGSKEGLFREILRRRLHERSASLRTAGVAGTNRLAERAERIIGDAEYTRLLMWEALETNPDRPVNEEIRREFFQTWVEAVDEEQRRQAARRPRRRPAGAQRDLPHGAVLLPQLHAAHHRDVGARPRVHRHSRPAMRGSPRGRRLWTVIR